MISTLKNFDGMIYAYAEWRVVDETGTMNSAGRYLYINDLWIHEKYRGKEVMNALIRLMDEHELVKHVVGVYWENLKHKNRLTPLYNRERLSKLSKRSQECFS